MPGAIYCDRRLRWNGFNGEGVVGAGVIVFKTHAPTPPKASLCHEGHCYDSVPAVVLVRNPRDAHVANWNRMKTVGHVATASYNLFRKFVSLYFCTLYGRQF